jgi:16S rRNA (cytidine1402-2'-O)-methyltransferase
LEKTLTALGEIIPYRSVCVARELTKTFEEFRRGTPAELLAHFQKHPPKGEITLLIAPEPKKRRPAAEEE